MSNKADLPETLVMPAPLRGWERFWFTPADPTLLGLMRIFCGLITLYTVLVYSFDLQAFMGPGAWYDLDMRLNIVRNRPVPAPPLDGHETADPVLWDEFDGLAPKEKEYVQEYFQLWNVNPPRPFPKDKAEADYINEFRGKVGFDYRTYYTPAPQDAAQKKYAEEYSRKQGRSPPAYPADDAEAQFVEGYIAREGVDPRLLYARGQQGWSVWFHVTDPTAMAVVHGVIVFVTFLFVIGFATRVTSALTWFAMLCYIHRNPNILFGVDTMMTILLLYLMIGPSGAALSVDRLIARWWSVNKPAVVRRWYRLLGRPEPTDAEIAPAVFHETPQPSVTANVAIRLTQIHICIIYLVAGLAKLQGTAWWNGTAPWGTIANYEFAPMQYEYYNRFLRQLTQNQFLIESALTSASLFTLVFEIGYPFMVWRPMTRWLSLAGAIMLHGLIGIFMGLKTFSLMMLVMNMAFLTPAEAKWLARWLTWDSAPPAEPARVPEPAPISREPALAGGPSTGIKKAR